MANFTSRPDYLRSEYHSVRKQLCGPVLHNESGVYMWCDVGLMNLLLWHCCRLELGGKCFQNKDCDCAGLMFFLQPSLLSIFFTLFVSRSFCSPCANLSHWGNSVSSESASTCGFLTFSNFLKTISAVLFIQENINTGAPCVCMCALVCKYVCIYDCLG